MTSLQSLQKAGSLVLRTAELSREDREALMRAGFLQPVIKGWYMPARPGEGEGETTAWYASASHFIARYCEARFGTQWCVGADHSIRLHTGNTALPAQVVVHAPAGGNTVIQLPAGHSLLDYRAKDFPPPGKRCLVGGLRAMQLEHALVRAPESFYRSCAADAQVALLSLKDGSALVREPLEGKHSVVAGRLAGALRACRRSELADEILATLRSVGHTVAETNPYAAPPPALKALRGVVRRDASAPDVDVDARGRDRRLPARARPARHPGAQPGRRQGFVRARCLQLPVHRGLPGDRP